MGRNAILTRMMSRGRAMKSQIPVKPTGTSLRLLSLIRPPAIHMQRHSVAFWTASRRPICTAQWHLTGSSLKQRPTHSTIPLHVRGSYSSNYSFDSFPLGSHQHMPDPFPAKTCRLCDARNSTNSTWRTSSVRDQSVSVVYLLLVCALLIIHLSSTLLPSRFS